MSIDPVSGETNSDAPRDVQIEAATHSDEPRQIRLMRVRCRHSKLGQQKTQLRRQRDIGRLVNPAKAGAREQRDLLPLSPIKLRPRGKDVGRRGESYIDGVRRRCAQRLCRDQEWGKNGFASVDGAGACDDRKVSTKAKPWSRRDAEVSFESPLGQIASWTHHVVEAGEERIAIDVGLLRDRRQAKYEDKKTLSYAFHSPHAVESRSESSHGVFP